MGLYKQVGSRVWWCKFKRNGQVFRRSTGETNKREALKAEVRLKVGVEQEIANQNDMLEDLPFDLFMNSKYLPWYQVDHSNGAYLKHVCSSKPLLEYFGSKPLSKFTVADLDDYKELRSTTPSKRNIGAFISPTTINAEFTLLGGAFKQARRWKLTQNPINPHEWKISLVGTERNRVLTHDEEEKLIEYASEWFKPVLIAALDVGISRADLLKLKWHDVNLDSNPPYIDNKRKKTHEFTRLPILTQRCYDALLAYRDFSLNENNPWRYVFVNRQGKPASADNFRYDMEKALRLAGLRGNAKHVRGLHDLRRTCGTNWGMDGLPTSQVKALMQHRSIQTTEKYMRINPLDVQPKKPIKRHHELEFSIVQRPQRRRMTLDLD